MRFLAFSALLMALPALAEVHSYDVKGMTCGGCVDTVKAEVCKLPGVTSCKVEIGKVVLDGPKLDDDAVKKAIDKAGYSVIGVEHADARGGADLKPDPGPTMKVEKTTTMKKTVKKTKKETTP